MVVELIDAEIDRLKELNRRNQEDINVICEQMNGRDKVIKALLNDRSVIEQRQFFDLAKARTIAETHGKLKAVKYFKDCTHSNLMDAKLAIESLAVTGNWKYATS